jgi:hypothetical protein
MSPAQQAENAGIDLSLIEESLRLTPEQRLVQHQAALVLVTAAEQIGLEQLIAAKEAVGRPKDLLVATELRAIAALSASPR